MTTDKEKIAVALYNANKEGFDDGYKKGFEEGYEQGCNKILNTLPNRLFDFLCFLIDEKSKSPENYQFSIFDGPRLIEKYVDAVMTNNPGIKS